MVPRLEFFDYCYCSRCLFDIVSVARISSSEEAVPIVVRVLLCFLLFMLMPLLVNMLSSCNWVIVVWFGLGFPWVVGGRTNAAPILSWLLLLPYGWTFVVFGYCWASYTAGWCYHPQASSSKWLGNGSDVSIVPGVNFSPQSFGNLNPLGISMLLKEEESSCGGLFYSGAVGVCTFVHTCIESGYWFGYLLLLPLVHMLKVLDDEAYVAYALWCGIGHVHIRHSW